MDIVDLKGTEFSINLIDSGIYTQKQLTCKVNSKVNVNSLEEEEEDKNKNNKKKKKSEFNILIENQTENLKII